MNHMDNLLGWGESTISRYESKAIQDDTYDKILRMIDSNPMEMMSFLNKNRPSFSSLRYISIKDKIIRNLDEYGKEYLKRRELENEYLKYQEPSDLNGFQVLNIDKIESIGHYKLLGLEKICVEEEYGNDGCSSFHILPCERANLTILSESKLSILSEVLAKFKCINGQEFSAYMHEEIAYKQTQDRQEIPFSLTNQLKDF